MTKKNWKTEKFGNGRGITFQNKKRGDYFIQVYADASHNPQWRTVIHADGKVIDESQSITRTKAITKANEYMRKN